MKTNTTKTPYIITADLENTGLEMLKASSATQELACIREKMIESINRSLGENKTRIFTYEEISDWFLSLQNPRTEFALSLDNGIYVKNADFYLDSTRMYENKDAILSNPKSYSIMSRTGKNLEDQSVQLNSQYNNKNMIIYDDGIFSGDTLESIIAFIQNSPNIRINEIRVFLNFSGKDSLGDIPIRAFYTGDCIDWIDERDFFYGVKMGGATFRTEKSLVSGVPYVSSTKLAEKKASITNNAAQFCKEMIEVNQDFWKIKAEIEDRVIRLVDVPRLCYLESQYNSNETIQNILDGERDSL